MSASGQKRSKGGQESNSQRMAHSGFEGPGSQPCGGALQFRPLCALSSPPGALPSKLVSESPTQLIPRLD